MPTSTGSTRRILPFGTEGESLTLTTILRADVPFGTIALLEYDVRTPQRQHVVLKDNVVEMLLTEHPVARTASIAQVFVARPLGEIVYLAADQPIDVDWPEAGRVRAVHCVFRNELIHPPRRYTSEELVAALDIRNPVIRKALLGIVEELLSPGFQSSLLASSLSAQVAVELGRYFRRRTTSRPTGRLSASQLNLIDARIEAGGNLPTAAELARDCKLSKRHFFRLFRQTTGMSLADYANRRRIDRAKDLLRRDTLVVKQIAHRCGFQTPSAFSAAFRRTTGMTPREYRMTSVG